MSQTNNSNGMGVAGFVLALISFFISWIPIIGWITWLLGFIFSFVGLFRSPRGFAIAGLVISLFGFILFILTLLGIGISLIGFGLV